MAKVTIDEIREAWDGGNVKHWLRFVAKLRAKHSLDECSCAEIIGRLLGRIAELERHSRELRSKRITLTAAQAEALMHRLEVPDAISEAISSDFEEVHERCEKFMQTLRETSTLAVADDLDRKILIDAVDGSTWWPVMKHHAECCERHEGLFMKRVESTLDALSKKISELVGESVWAPFH